MESNQDTSQDQLAPSAESGLMTDEVSRAERHRPQPFRRFRSIGSRSGVEASHVERIEADLVLLREENARLRFERAQRPDAGSTIERLKALSAAQPPSADRRDEAWHLISEALVMRDVLIDVCKEIGQMTITLQTRLNNLTLDLPDRINSPAAHERHASLASPPASAH
jgi:hypothetical protein